MRALTTQRRPIDRERDLPAVLELLGRRRAAGGLTHPGGMQWWRRELWRAERTDFGANVWADGSGPLGGFALVDETFVVLERLDPGPTMLEQVAWLEDRLAADGRAARRSSAGRWAPATSSSGTTPARTPPAFGLYTGAGMPVRRRLIELRKELGSRAD